MRAPAAPDHHVQTALGKAGEAARFTSSFLFFNLQTPQVQIPASASGSAKELPQSVEISVSSSMPPCRRKACAETPTRSHHQRQAGAPASAARVRRTKGYDCQHPQDGAIRLSIPSTSKQFHQAGTKLLYDADIVVISRTPLTLKHWSKMMDICTGATMVRATMRNAQLLRTATLSAASTATW